MSDESTVTEDAHAHEVHTFPGVGIEEGNGRVPRWFVLVMLALFVFFVVYLAQFLTGVQPSSAQLK